MLIYIGNDYFDSHNYCTIRDPSKIISTLRVRPWKSDIIQEPYINVYHFILYYIYISKLGF